MAKYVDGFVIPVPEKNLKEYVRIAKLAGKLWKEHGALEVWECVGDDLDTEMAGIPFARTVRLKPGETVIFSWILFKSRAHRDRVNARVMKDPRMAGIGKDMPFDHRRTVYGGFTTLVRT